MTASSTVTAASTVTASSKVTASLSPLHQGRRDSYAMERANGKSRFDARIQFPKVRVLRLCICFVKAHRCIITPIMSKNTHNTNVQYTNVQCTNGRSEAPQ